MPALRLSLRGLNIPRIPELLQSLSSCLGELHTLALDCRYQPEDPYRLLYWLGQLLEGGQLPALSHVLMCFTPSGPLWGDLGRWRPGLEGLLRAGCAVHLLPTSTITSEEDVRVFEQMKRALHDPGMLRLGVRSPTHQDGT